MSTAVLGIKQAFNCVPVWRETLFRPSSVFVVLLTQPLLCLVFSDGIHHPDSGLRFCLPPGGATHLHWATRVSPKVTVCFDKMWHKKVSVTSSSLVCLHTSATKKRMQSVANISILAMFVMYLLTALFGYLTFFGKILSTPESQRSPCSDVVNGKKNFQMNDPLVPRAHVHFPVLWMSH